MHIRVYNRAVKGIECIRIIIISSIYIGNVKKQFKKFPIMSNIQFNLYAVVVDGNDDGERVQGLTQKALTYNTTLADF